MPSREVGLGHAGDEAAIPPLGPSSAAAIFSAGAFLLYCGTKAIPPMAAFTGAEPVLMWFVAASIFLFIPLLGLGSWMLSREAASSRPRSWVDRLRLRPMDARDWLWCLGALAAIASTTGASVLALRLLSLDHGLHPSFMAFDPLGPGRLAILAAWLPFFALNILGEEFVWRGVVLPMQEEASGEHAWLYQGLGWWIMHVAFPWQVLLALLPTALILPYVAQRRRSTRAAIVIHAALNGPGFLALAFGLA